MVLPKLKMMMLVSVSIIMYFSETSAGGWRHSGPISEGGTVRCEAE